MKADREFGWGDDPGPNALRTTLREWKAPGPPPELEDELRREFRRRRPKRLPGFWLAAAAGLALLLLSREMPPGRPKPPAAEAPASASWSIPTAPAAPPAAPIAAPRPPEARASGSGGSARERRVPPPEPPVVVEPGQAALLTQLARGFGNLRQAAPAGLLPRLEAAPEDSRVMVVRQALERDEVLPHHTEWERVGSEWPFVQQALTKALGG